MKFFFWNPFQSLFQFGLNAAEASPFKLTTMGRRGRLQSNSLPPVSLNILILVG
uniref:Uncharacterized protein n=1 Tax=Anguilla anguilla TaxID=7936 RepID=A0A0E9X7Z2_ANGAN